VHGYFVNLLIRQLAISSSCCFANFQFKQGFVKFVFISCKRVRKLQSLVLFGSLVTLLTKTKSQGGNAYLREILSTVHLLYYSLDRLLFILKILCAFYSKQAILTMRSMVLSLSLQLVFPDQGPNSGIL